MTVKIRLTPLGKFAGAMLGIAALIFSLLVLPALGAIMGAITGFLVGILFGTPILKALASFGVENLSMWEFGCFLGFVAGFFRERRSSKKS